MSDGSLTSGDGNPWRGKRIPGTRRRSLPPLRGARGLALEALITFAREEVFLGKTLDQLYQQQNTPPRDRRLATELASETLRRGYALDAILSQYVVRGRDSVEPDLWHLLQLGACQILCLRHIPAHAAVHETVELCEQIGKQRAKGFVNGTLRSIERELTIHEGISLPNLEQLPELLPQSDWRANRWPQLIQRGAGYEVQTIELSRDVFDDPTDPFQVLSYIAQVTSLPDWLIQRWNQHEIKEGRGPKPYDQLMARGLWFTTPGRLSLRVNSQRATTESVLQMLAEQNLPSRGGQLPESIVLQGSTAVTELPGFHEGDFSVQDESAMLATALLNPQPGESILDLCAAPGGKTCHIAERLQGTGRVVACDVSPERIRTIQHNVDRLQLKNVEVFGLDPEGKYTPPGPFDAVLVDVPCSNTGVLGKRPEARWRLTPKDFQELVPLQKQLLHRALDLVKPGGRVVYSTCSIDSEENSDLVRSVLNERADAELKQEVFHQPGHPADGGYQCLIFRKTSPAESGH